MIVLLKFHMKLITNITILIQLTTLRLGEYFSNLLFENLYFSANVDTIIQFNNNKAIGLNISGYTDQDNKFK